MPPSSRSLGGGKDLDTIKFLAESRENTSKRSGSEQKKSRQASLISAKTSLACTSAS